MTDPLSPDPLLREIQQLLEQRETLVGSLRFAKEAPRLLRACLTRLEAQQKAQEKFRTELRRPPYAHGEQYGVGWFDAMTAALSALVAPADA